MIPETATPVRSAGGINKIGGEQSMLDGVGQVPLLDIPAAGPVVQGRENFWLALAESIVQYLRKELMIAVPLPQIVERDQKEIGLGELL